MLHRVDIFDCISPLLFTQHIIDLGKLVVKGGSKVLETKLMR